MFQILASSADHPPSEICWMPAGTHDLNAGLVGGGNFNGKVICDAESANAVIASFNELRSSGQRMILDIDHENSAAAAEVTGFYWSPSRGIMARVTWLPIGADALGNKAYSSFSPTFMANQCTGKISGLVPGKPVGGITNFPAFKNAMPLLIAARLGDNFQIGGNTDDAGDAIALQIRNNKLQIYE